MNNREQHTVRPTNAHRNTEPNGSVLSDGTYEVTLCPDGAVMFRRLVPPLLSGRLIRLEEYTFESGMFFGPNGYAVVDLCLTTPDELPSEEFYAIVGDFEVALSGWESWPAVRLGPSSEVDVMSPIVSGYATSS